MNLVLASISPRRKAKSAPAEALAHDYISRAARLCATVAAIFDSEAALLASAERQPGRTAAQLILFDSRGENFTSEDFARYLGSLRDAGCQRIVLAIGPANGWSASTLTRAQKVLSLGRMTLPHELARVLVAEQVYRALTILAGHPYHSAH